MSFRSHISRSQEKLRISSFGGYCHPCFLGIFLVLTDDSVEFGAYSNRVVSWLMSVTKIPIYLPSPSRNLTLLCASLTVTEVLVAALAEVTGCF